ncbi:MAG: type II methionyl aminopeptidase [Thaumarchaeota archaeon]|nr:type II methionyl aminopeptidase [Nitrososphaerota archaeon]
MEDLDRFREAGAIARKARDEAYKLVREGVKVIEVCEAIEDIIRSSGAEPAFPCNVGINEVAAHYTSPPGDQTTIPPRSIVKVDVGVSLDGYLADTATTIALAPELEVLAEASKLVLREAIKAMSPGVSVSRIGLIIQKTANQLGFKPIRNLTGHEIKRYELHAGLTIPNVATVSLGRLKENHIYAVEPFLTTRKGAGEVVSAKFSTIFRVDPNKLSGKKLKPEERTLLRDLADRFKGLPYTPRWIKNFDKVGKIHEKLVRLGRIYGYPVLVELFGEPVAQSEHTVIVTEKGCEVIT